MGSWDKLDRYVCHDCHVKSLDLCSPDPDVWDYPIAALPCHDCRLKSLLVNITWKGARTVQSMDAMVLQKIMDFISPSQKMLSRLRVKKLLITGICDKSASPFRPLGDTLLFGSDRIDILDHIYSCV